MTARDDDTIAESRGRAIVTVAALCCGNAAPALIYDALAPVLPQIAAHFGGGIGGETVAQSAVSLAVVGMGLAGLFAAAAVARFGFRHVLTAGWATFGIAGSAGLLLNEPAILLASRLLLGLSGGTLMAVAGLGIAARYDQTRRPTMMGINLAVGAFTGFLFLFLAAAAAQLSWRAPFALHAALAVVGLVLVAYARLPARIVAPGLVSSSNGFVRALRPALPAYGLLLVTVLTGNLFNVQIVFLLAARGFRDPTTLAAICAIMPLALGITNIGFGGIERRLGLGRTVKAALALFVAGTLLCAVTPSLVLTSAGMVAGGVALGLCTPAAMTLIMRGVEARCMPTALSFATTLFYVGGGAAPLLWVPLRASVGHAGIYAIAGATILAGLLIMSLANRAGGIVPITDRRRIR